MILGAGLTGMSAAIDMRRYPHIETVGFLDDDPSKYNRVMARYRVLGNSEELETLCSRYRVTDLLICAGSLDTGKLQRLRQRCLNLEIRLHLVPTLDRMFREEPGIPTPDETALWLANADSAGDRSAGARLTTS